MEHVLLLLVGTLGIGRTLFKMWFKELQQQRTCTYLRHGKGRTVSGEEEISKEGRGSREENEI